jgi:hypothetical protein
MLCMRLLHAGFNHPLAMAVCVADMHSDRRMLRSCALYEQHFRNYRELANASGSPARYARRALG